ncbi:MAG TPA: gentisate 1,2-dioxygenase [Stellaceae bacterium]|nr:gentisate 1,2-dioxygenase [Stellaceae bacterium]
MEGSVPAHTPEREAFYREISPANLAPLWEVLHGLVTPEPVTPVQPVLWRYSEVRPHIERAGTIISAAEAERRVLVLENPGLRGRSCITHSLYAGLQLILPGEVARAHRHAASALRFILEGSGAYTAVDGERTYMQPGDFVITPSWTFHDHGNTTDTPMVWLDGLDVPLVNLLDTSFQERSAAETQDETRQPGDSLARFGAGLMPVDWKPRTRTSPVFTYPWEHTRAALETMKREQEWDPVHGLKLKFINPATGDHAMPTIGTFMQLLPAGFSGAPYRATDSTVYVCVEGKGMTHIGDQFFAWGPRDIFVVPSWHRHFHHAEAESVLFSFSDRPVQEKLDLWREDRGNH